ncbi:DUF1272 domain-containing protein [Aquimarina sp. 2201CG5-10]|uniref:DUF1272 domain-containing protein n=1 Tax=Aquimarina callyspongiae TaxID=3098150 RepID=UPI002AB5D077|nr:DUF1272 domain-containing protein [Aquimarina sp. 2201CG5-10]MDY8135703.1 DUF1272 domain-containing protein [Aquimarina sp. 2201CG5-10]
MLEIRPTCENCNKALPNDSTEAMICSFECTFCKDCVDNIFHNVCPNCGGGFEKRPTRPVNCLTGNCVDKYPVGTRVVYKPIDDTKFKKVFDTFRTIEPSKR